jgi:hypothetical protein
MAAIGNQLVFFLKRLAASYSEPAADSAIRFKKNSFL